MSHEFASQPKNIPDADDTNDCAALEHRHMPNVMAVHEIESVIDVVVRRARDDIGRHELRDWDFQGSRAMVIKSL